MRLTFRKNLLIIGPLLVVVIFAGFVLAYSHQSHADAQGCTSKDGVVVHQVTIKDDQVSPQITDGQLCDKITFTNEDNVTREIAFGPHEHHVAYDGVAERILGDRQSFTITLNQSGMFHFHDHAHDEVMGYFNVAK